MKILSLPEIKSLIDLPGAIDAVRQSFIEVENGLITQPDPMQILFNDRHGNLVGDCHVKAARSDDKPCFAIKAATGFYKNPSKGINVNHGLVLVLSSETGAPVALLQDGGWLTQLRTAAAGALAASLKPVAVDGALGVLGTGTQAKLQAQAISCLTGLKHLFVLGKTARNVDLYIGEMTRQGFSVSAVADAKTLCEHSDHSLGGMLAGKHPEPEFSAAGISIVDLTGLGAQDLAVAASVVSGAQSRNKEFVS